MNAADMIGWVSKDGDYYCLGCCPTNEPRGDFTPIFGESETDSFNHCVDCEGLIPEALTNYGYEDTIVKFKRFLTLREGRPEILRQWAEHMQGWSDIEASVVLGLVIDAADCDNLKAALKNSLIYGGLKAVIDAECDLARAMKEIIK